MTLADFAKLVRDREAQLAPGNETPLLAHLHLELEDCEGPAWRSVFNGDDVAEGYRVLDHLSPGSRLAAWWMEAYDLWAIDLKRAPADRYGDIQDLFDAVDAS